MTSIFGKDQPALFLGVAGFIESPDAPFPLGGVDLFQLSQHKSHIVYPGMIQSDVWVVLVSTEFLEGNDLSKWELRIADEDDVELGKLNFESLSYTKTAEFQLKTNMQETEVAIVKDSLFTMLHFKLDCTVSHPGKYTVYSNYDGKVVPIGSVHFHYRKASALTPDQIKAIESDPHSIKSLLLTIGCKHCPTTLKTYTGLIRSPKLEKQGCVWQTDLDSSFACQCGKVNYSLEYLKESMHGMLLKDFNIEHTGLSYVRRYGHSQVVKVVDEFKRLLDRERLEPPAQRFIEQHPILLCRFHAKRLFVKPSIVGRFEADFAVVDSRNELWLIELEKPSLQLFKKNGHPTQALMHAYGQVTDWLEQYARYSGAILDRLDLKAEDVLSVHGAVIAGRSRDVTYEVLQRHLSHPPYPNIDFMTCDDLGVSLLEISKKIA
ncbi:MAG: Shedu anti-phage system protein SduA domain-containing protein [Dongiaceae bacterium]